MYYMYLIYAYMHIQKHINKTIHESCGNRWRCIKEHFRNSAFKTIYTKSEESNIRFNHCLQTALQHFMIQSDHYKRGLHEEEKNTIRIIKEKLSNDRELRKLYYQKLVVKEIKDRICYTKLMREEIFKLDENLFVEPDVFLFDCNHGISLGNTTILLATMDIGQYSRLFY